MLYAGFGDATDTLHDMRTVGTWGDGVAAGGGLGEGGESDVSHVIVPPFPSLLSL